MKKKNKRKKKMKKYTVTIPEMEFTVNADDENDAEYQTIALFDWGNVDMEVEEIETKERKV